METLALKYARKLVLKRLQTIENESDDYCKFGQIEWRKNYGCFELLPFYETSDEYYFEGSKGVIYGGDLVWPIDPAKCFEEGVDRGKFLFSPDITIFSKGTPVAVILFVEDTYSSFDRKIVKKINDFF